MILSSDTSTIHPVFTNHKWRIKLRLKTWRLQIHAKAYGYWDNWRCTSSTHIELILDRHSQPMSSISSLPATHKIIRFVNRYCSIPYDASIQCVGYLEQTATQMKQAQRVSRHAQKPDPSKPEACELSQSLTEIVRLPWSKEQGWDVLLLLDLSFLIPRRRMALIPVLIPHKSNMLAK